MKTKQLALAAACVLAVSGAANAQSLAGKWTAEYPASVRNVNGEVTAERGTAVVVIEQKGDSVFGTWHAQNTPRKSEPRRIVGTLKAGQLNLVAEPIEATLRRGGADADEQKVMMRSFFEARLEADSLAGTMYSESDDGSIKSSPLKWSARRTPRSSVVPQE